MKHSGVSPDLGNDTSGYGGEDGQDSSNMINQDSRLGRSSLQQSKVVKNERGEFVTIGEIEELPPSSNYKNSLAHLNK